MYLWICICLKLFKIVPLKNKSFKKRFISLPLCSPRYHIKNVFDSRPNPVVNDSRSPLLSEWDQCMCYILVSISSSLIDRYIHIFLSKLRGLYCINVTSYVWPLLKNGDLPFRKLPYSYCSVIESIRKQVRCQLWKHFHCSPYPLPHNNLYCVCGLMLYCRWVCPCLPIHLGERLGVLVSGELNNALSRGENIV